MKVSGDTLFKVLMVGALLIMFGAFCALIYVMSPAYLFR